MEETECVLRCSGPRRAVESFLLNSLDCVLQLLLVIGGYHQLAELDWITWFAGRDSLIRKVSNLYNYRNSFVQSRNDLVLPFVVYLHETRSCRK